MNITEELKTRLDIAAVVSEVVALDKSGRNLRGLCPFHGEKTPSFFVFPERQTWKCFGCGAGGDVISFVMKKEGIEFGEALKLLAQRAGMALPERQRITTEEDNTSVFYQINEAAAVYFQKLLRESPEADAAREYIEGRGLASEIIEEFRLGFSLDSWDGLRLHLKNIGYSDSDMVTAGVLIQKEDRIYDRFRGRLMFSICDHRGRVVGFGARALDDQMPKYLNSSQSPVFDKSSVLYGIDRAKPAIRDKGRVVIVEGYMDVLTAHQNGFKNVVASMGTSLTEKQISILKGVASRITLSLDADAAGDAATLRGIEVCRAALSEGVKGERGWLGKSTALGADIDIISLPEGKDPDDVIRDDPANWQRLVDQAQPLMDFQFEAIASEFSLTRPEDRIQLSERLLPLISEMRDSAFREVYLTKLSKMTGISERVLAGKLAERFYVKGKAKPRKKNREQLDHTRKTMGDQLEEMCLCLLLQYPSLREVTGELDSDYFERSENREIFKAWQELEGASEVVERIAPVLKEHFEFLKNRELPPQDRKQQERNLMDCVSRLEERRLRSQMICEAASVGEGQKCEEISKRLIDLQRRRATSGWR